MASKLPCEQPESLRLGRASLARHAPRPNENDRRPRAARSWTGCSERSKRRRTIRRGVIVAIVAAVVVGSAALLFSGSKSTATTTTTSTTTSTTTTTTTIPDGGPDGAQIDANAAAVKAGCPATPHTRVNTLKWSCQPAAMAITTAQSYDATVVTDRGHVRRSSSSPTGAAHGEQLHLPGAPEVLQLRDLPSGHPGLRHPGRRPDGHRHRRTRLHDPRRVPQDGRRATVPAATRWPWPTRLARHRRQPVLHRHRLRRREPRPRHYSLFGQVISGRGASRRSTPRAPRPSRDAALRTSASSRVTHQPGTRTPWTPMPNPDGSSEKRQALRRAAADDHRPRQALRRRRW